VLTFNYKAATIDGGTVSGVLSGKSRNDIAGQLHALGHVPIHIDETEVRADRKRTRLLSKRRIDDVQVADFTRDLSTLLRAGVALDQALSILSTLSEGQELGEVIGQIHARVKGGTTLADAIEEHDTLFNRLYVNMLRAGESGGALEVVLERLSEHSALIYPAILIVVAVVSVLILLGYVVPQFTEMFASAGEALPASTRVTIAVGEALRSYGWLLALMVITSIITIRKQLENPARLKHWHNWLLKLPVAGQIILKRSRVFREHWRRCCKMASHC
jgi:general secretion pathway protein F